MARTAAKVTQADIARTLRAIKDAGVSAAVEIAPDGTIRIVPTSGPSAAGAPARLDKPKEFSL